MLKERKLIASDFQKDVTVTLSPHTGLVGNESRTRWTRLTDKVKSLRRLPNLRGQKTYGSDEEHEVDAEDMGSGDLGSSLHDSEDHVSKKHMVVEPSHPLAQAPVTLGAGHDSRPPAEAVRKDQDQTYLVGKKSQSLTRGQDEVGDLLLRWTDLTNEELLEAGLGTESVDRRRSWMFT